MYISTSFDIGTKPKKKTTSMYLPMKEKIEIFTETNFQALFLLEFYLSVFAIPDYIIDDNKTSIATELSIRSVQDNRRLLEKKNLFCVIKTTNNTGITCYLYCARKEGVYCKKYFGRLFGFSSVSSVYRYFTREQFDDVLIKNKLTPMDKSDIKQLLELYHNKVNKSRNYNHNGSW